MGAAMSRKRIGELLLERGAITPDQLEAALQAQGRSRQRLGAVLVAQGAITEKKLAHALGEALGMPVMDLANRAPDWSAIHLLRPRFCEQHELFPVSLESVGGRRVLVVAMGDPLDSAAVREMEFTTGLKVNVRVAPLSAVRAAIQRYYQRGTPAAAAPPPQEEDEEVIVGEEVPSADTARTLSLTELIQQREEAQRRKRAQARAAEPTGDIGAELDSLFGEAPAASAPADPVEELERKFWALMRIMARKGLLTQEEFTRELDDAQDD
jgi:hypothetical protein